MEAMRAILVETGGHNAERYDRAYWDWQYRQLPTGKAQVYVAWHGERIVGYYHIPVYDCVIDGADRRIGNIQDVAMLAEHRGQGTFRDLALFANAGADASPDVDLIYTFPNVRSIHTFLKYNAFQRLITYPTFVMPLDAAAIAGRKVPVLGHVAGAVGGGLLSLLRSKPKLRGSVSVSDNADAQVASVFHGFSGRYRCHLKRDVNWLNWRYAHSPRGRHWFIASRINDQAVAAVVVKVDAMFGSPALVVMDMAHSTSQEPELRALLAHICRRHSELIGTSCHLAFYAGQSELNSGLRSLGFIEVPARFNPRLLNLLVRDTGGVAQTSFTDASSWTVTLGDWDVL
jgi:hypothetical protein